MWGLVLVSIKDQNTGFGLVSAGPKMTQSWSTGGRKDVEDKLVPDLHFPDKFLGLLTAKQGAVWRLERDFHGFEPDALPHWPLPVPPCREILWHLEDHSSWAFCFQLLFPLWEKL